MEYGKKEALSSLHPSETRLAAIHDSLFSFPPPKAPLAQRRHNIVALLILAVIVLLAYSNSFRADFAQDSRGIVLEDPRLRAPSKENIQNILRENYWWPKGESGLYRPVTTFTYLLNYSVLGNEEGAAGFHWINLFLHVCNAFLVYLLAWRLFVDRRVALAIAALWALHPICTEAVTNIVGRADELAAFATLAGILLYIRSTQERGWRRAAWLTGLAAMVTIGIFSKENTVITAALLPFYDLSFRTARRQGGRLRHAAAYLARYCARGYVVLIPALLLFIHQRRSMFQKSRPVQMPFVDNPILGADFVTSRLTAIKVFGRSLGLLLWPRKLSCDYSFNRISFVDWHMRRLEDVQALAGLAAMIALVAIGIFCWRRHRLVSFWIGFALLTYLPTSNFLIPIGSIMAERFLYLPSIGFAACIVIAARAAGQRLRLRTRWLAAAVVTLAMGWGIRTFERNRDWADDETLWSQALAVAPDSFKPHSSLARIWFQRDGVSWRSIHEAEAAVTILNTLPDRLNVATAYQDLGFYYFLKGESVAPQDSGHAVPLNSESRQWYLKAATVFQHGAAIDREFNASARRATAACAANSATCPTFGLTQLHSDLGLVYLRMDRPKDAIAEYLYARKIAPANPATYRSLAGAYLQEGDSASAAVSLWGAAMLDSSGATTLYLLRLYDDFYPKSCATYFHDGREFLNTGCPLIQGQRCCAIADIAEAHSEAGEVRRSLEIQEGSRQQGCRAALP
jgi:protein O-mannosyl-transferase